MPKTTYLRNKYLDDAFRGIAYSWPATVYFGLSIGSPGASGSLSGEPSGGGYARVALTISASNIKGTGGETAGASAGSSGELKNGVSIAFPTSSGAWGSGINYLFISDAASAGNMLAYGEILTPFNVTGAGESPLIPVDGLILRDI